jgi:hypothetical protein
MIKDEKDRLNNCLRQKRHYNKTKPNASITATSQRSSSSSSTSVKEKIIKKEKIQFIENQFKAIPVALMNKWREVAPEINIADEIKKAELWLLAHPEKRRSRYEAFLSNWMVKAQSNFIKYGGNGGKPNANQRDGQRQALPGYDEADEITRRRQARIQQSAAVGSARGNAVADDVPDFPSRNPGRVEELHGISGH